MDIRLLMLALQRIVIDKSSEEIAVVHPPLSQFTIPVPVLVQPNFYFKIRDFGTHVHTYIRYNCTYDAKEVPVRRKYE